jgi:uncharacterized membrane protein YphA (DoxX/SURF4 family)
MEIALWIGQILLAAIFLPSGILKSIKSSEYLVKTGQIWFENIPLPTIRFIGISEILGSIGSVLPWYLDIIPVLTPLSALGLTVIMILAIRLHYMRSRANAEARSKELFSVKWTSLILALCIFVAMGRFMSLL